MLTRTTLRLLAIVVGLAAAGSAATAGGSALRPAPAQIGLFSAAAGVDVHGRLMSVPSAAAAPFLPGTRVLARSGWGDGSAAPAVLLGQHLVAAEQRAAEQRDWLAAGCLPGRGTALEGMVRDALLDLKILTLPSGAAVAGTHPSWRYVWPRDASFVAAALARAGHPADAVRVLAYLQAVQPPEGRFEARYSPESGRPPDDRGVQLDGSGWVLWGLEMTAASLPAADRSAALARLRPLLDRSARALLASVAGGRSLPSPSPDYWEVPEDDVTLGTVAPVLAGLTAAQRLYDRLGDGEAAAAAGAAARRLDARIRRSFGRKGYQRYRDGGGADAAVAMLLPPFAPSPRSDVVRAFEDAVPRLRQPAGGLAPGAGWRDDGVSWTPETALFGYVSAALGDLDAARGWLRWLDDHRTEAGSLPEKVLDTGRPASVAPLAWTAALVVLTVAEPGVAGGTGCH